MNALLKILKNKLDQIRILHFSLVVFLILMVWFGGYYYIKLNWEPSTTFYWQLIFSRLCLLGLIAVIIAWVSKNWKPYFNSKGSIFNLSVFRLIFFGFFTIGVCFQFNNFHEYLHEFADLPSTAQQDLSVISWFQDVIPVSKTLLTISLIIFSLAAVSSFIGFKTRIAILLFVISGLYLFLIPNMYGKVNHNHHIIWFASILLFSNCGETFSLDAWLERKKGNVSVQMESENNRLPFALIWILIGIIYFFPGFWKVWTCGLDWALTDNVKNHMLLKWNELGGWDPIYPLHESIFLYKISGVYTIFFELFFIALIFHKKTRLIAIIGGLLFHVGTFLFMNIFFVVLVVSYASFINWEKLFRKSRTEDDGKNNQLQANRNLLWVGRILIGAGLLFGVLKIHSWPFTVYPLFDSMASIQIQSLEFGYMNNEGDFVKLDDSVLMESYSPERYKQLENQIIEAYENDDLSSQYETLEVLCSKLDTSSEQIEVYVVDELITDEKSVQREYIYTSQ